MKVRNESTFLSPVICWTALGATLIVTPFASFDPINVPKLAVIATGGSVVLATLIAKRKSLLLHQNRIVTVFSAVFVSDLLLVFFFSGTNPTQEFFGTYGRATGFLAYLALCALLLGAVVSASGFFMKRFVIYMILTGGLSLVYGVLQSIGADPIDWNNQYNPVIGFLGNPNFQSSFVGFSGVLAFAFIINKSTKRVSKLAYWLYFLVAVFVIISTDSQQGVFVLLGGITFIILIWISKSRFKNMTYPALMLSGFGGTLVALGSLNIGPLATLLYKQSVTYRGDYWRAGWRMTVEHPFLGVGLDSYGEWYRRSRSLDATLRRGPDVTSNAAHNVLLDFSSNGGLPLLLIYLALMGLVVISAWKLIKRMISYDPIVVGLIAVWIVYQAQSVISLNQIGLAVWGWVISGLIIGYELCTRDDQIIETQKSYRSKLGNKRNVESRKIDSTSLVVVVTGITIGLLAGLPPFIASTKFKSAISTGTATSVQQAAYLWPDDPMRYGQVATVLQANKLEAQAHEVVLAGLSKFPNEFGLWKILSESKVANSLQIVEARKQMKRLDPLNPELK